VICSNRFKGRADQKWDINFNFFDQWTPELGYLIGLLITDGSIRENGQVNFVSKDKELSGFVRDTITPSKPLREERTRKNNPVWRWEVWSIPLVNILGQFGITPRKSLNGTFPTIPEAIKWHFIRGVLDGDGTVDKARRISFSSGSSDFANALSFFLLTNGFSPHLYPAKRSLVVYLSVKDSLLLARKLYEGNPFCLKRKKARIPL